MSKIHKWNWSVSYTVFVGTIDLQNETLLIQLQKYPITFILAFFVSQQIIQIVVALTHFFNVYHTLKTRLNT